MDRVSNPKKKKERRNLGGVGTGGQAERERENKERNIKMAKKSVKIVHPWFGQRQKRSSTVDQIQQKRQQKVCLSFLSQFLQCMDRWDL